MLARKSIGVLLSSVLALGTLAMFGCQSDHGNGTDNGNSSSMNTPSNGTDNGAANNGSTNPNGGANGNINSGSGMNNNGNGQR